MRFGKRALPSRPAPTVRRPAGCRVVPEPLEPRRLFSVTPSAAAPALTQTVSASAATAQPPTIAKAAAASPATVTGETTVLTALGADSAGAASLTYTWAATGPAAVTYSANGTNAAQSTTATFAEAGSYTFTVTVKDGAGLTVTSSVSATVKQTVTGLSITPYAVLNMTGGQTQTMSASAVDQFGAAMSPQPAVTWSVASGGGTVTAAGVYTAPTTGGQAVVRATVGSVYAATTLDIVPAGWTSADIGSPAIAGAALGKGSTFSLAGEGTDIWGTADQFHYVYQTLTGNGSVTAMVEIQSDTNAFAKAGVMFRSTLAAGSPEAAVVLTPGDGTQFQYRTTTGGTSDETDVAGAAWVRLVRSGNVFTAYDSTNDQTWTQVGAAETIAMGQAAYVGLAVCSHDTAAVSTAEFGNVAVTPAAATGPTVLNAAAATAVAAGGKTTTLSVLGTDPASLTYTWAATGPAAVTYSANGTAAADSTTATFAKAGTYTFVVTLKDPSGLTATSSVTVVVAQAVKSVVVTPGSVTLVNAGDAEQLSAAATDQFGNAMTTTFTWSITSGSGTVTKAGLYVAGAAGTSATVAATAGGVSGTAAVTVKPRPFTVYDDLTYTNAPVAAAYGLPQATVMYDGYIWNPSDTTLLYNQTDGEYATLPDEATFKASVLTHIADQHGNTTVPGAIILDIERIQLSTGTAAEVEQNFNVLTTLAQWTEQVAPKDTVGFYTTNGDGILPTPWGSAYQSYAVTLANTVDAFFPSMYVSAHNTAVSVFESEETGLVAQAKALAPGKPVYFYLWPQYDETGNAFIPAAAWTQQLTESEADGGAGVVLWSGSSTAFVATNAWWPATLSFVAGIASPVIGSVTESASSVAAGTIVTLAANTVDDAGATVSAVRFYVESNTTAGLQTTGDTLLGSAVDDDGNWSYALNTTGATAGTYTLYAVAVDSDGVSTLTGVQAAGVTLVITGA
jgi:hypothetical protein